MILHVTILLGLSVVLVVLVRRNLIQVDMSFPWFAAILILGFLSMREDFVAWVAERLGIIYAPIAIVLIAVFILFALVTVVLVGITELRRRHIRLVRYLVGRDLAQQEARRLPSLVD